MARGADRRGLAWVAAVILIVCAAGFVRLETIGARPIWYDEIYTFGFCQDAGSLSDVWRAGTVDTWEHPPLHYLVACLSLEIAETLTLLRLPSALGGIANVVLLALLGSVLWGRRVGVVAGLLLAGSVYHINYSMDGRPYALLLALATGELLCLYVFLRDRRRWVLFPLVLCGAGSLYTHHTAVHTQATLSIIVLGHWISAFARRRAAPEEARNAARDALPLIGAFLAIAVLYLPQLALLFQFLGSDRLAAKHTLAFSPMLFHQLFARWGAGPGWISLVYEIGLLAGLVAIAMRRDRSAGLIPWLLLPILGFVLVPFGKFFDIRFVMTGLPAFCLIVAVGVVTLGSLLSHAALRAGSSAAISRALGQALVALLTIVLVVASARAYVTFRVTRARCSNFVWTPSLLEENDGFCRKHILLNSLIPEDERLLLVPLEPDPPPESDPRS